MKKKIIIIISIIFIVAIAVFGIIVKRKNTGISNLKVIAEKSYINWAWGFQYTGEAILNDGTIIKWNYSGDYSSYDAETIREKNKWILQNCEIKTEKLSKSDLEALSQYINKIEDKIEEKESRGHDMGSSTVKIYNYEKKKILTLSETGDFVKKNNTQEAQECLKLIEKYL